MMKDYYKILGLSYPATFDEVQSSFWRHYLMPNVGIQNRQARQNNSINMQPVRVMPQQLLEPRLSITR